LKQALNLIFRLNLDPLPVRHPNQRGGGGGVDLMNKGGRLLYEHTRETLVEAHPHPLIAPTGTAIATFRLQLLEPGERYTPNHPLPQTV